MVYLTFTYGRFPWIALILAITFGLYGLLRKTAVLEALEGLTIETTFLFIPALIILLIFEKNGIGSFGHTSIIITILLVCTGIVTSLPLLFFTIGARRIPLTYVGIMQYIAPIMQFLIGVLIYQEDFSKTRVIGFILIWIALLIFTVEGMIIRNKLSRAGCYEEYNPNQAS
jgi:chloramphenicol-sensitive protein RarD